GRRDGREWLPRGRLRDAPRAAPHRRRRLRAPGRRRGAGLVGGRGARRVHPVVPLPHAAPQRSQPLPARAAGAVPHLQRRVARRPARGVLPGEARGVRAAGRVRRAHGRVAHRRLPGPSGVSGGPGAPAEVEPATRVDEVVELYRRWAWHRYDESVSQLDHALQTAALAERDGAPDALVAAALLHDVGHLLDLAAADGAYGERTV